jgi:hypothetical protein
MSKSHKIGRNSSFVSIWKAPAGKELPDANEHKKAPTPVIGIEALRTINRIVLAIEEKIAAASERTKSDNGDQPCSAGDPRSSRITNSNSGTDNNEEERR